jgi:dTDP-4-dehydrorhamnose reductase
VTVLITGAGGMLAQAVTRELQARRKEVVALSRADLDVRDRDAVSGAVAFVHPDCVIHCAAYTRVDDAETDRDAAFDVNVGGTLNVAGACRAIGARLLYPSTDYVFDGKATEPYTPSSPMAPLNAYGISKMAGEECARAAGDYLVVRTSWLYGAGGKNFVATILQRAREVDELQVVDDQRGSPTWTHDLARAFADLLEREAPAGVYHATNAGDTTWYDFARAATRAAGIDVAIKPIKTDDTKRPAKRPRYSVLDCTSTEALIGPMRMWRDALQAALVEGV